MHGLVGLLMAESQWSSELEAQQIQVIQFANADLKNCINLFEETLIREHHNHSGDGQGSDLWPTALKKLVILGQHGKWARQNKSQMTKCGLLAHRAERGTEMTEPQK